MMAYWKIFTLACTASIFVDAKNFQHQKREIPSNICDPVYNSTDKVQCYCTKDHTEIQSVRSADCYLTVAAVTNDDEAWSSFKTINTVQKITFTNTRGFPFNYVPTEALKETTSLKRLDIKYGIINTIGAFAFANLSSLQEITLRDNQIVILDPYAFIHHKELKTISLDTNNLSEINRNVFVDLPALEQLYFTNNQISTIHDRAFIELNNLKELEIDRNKVFSLNFAVFEGLNNLEKLDLSSNSLEVIGDNTFQALTNLKSLNLEGNKIQMIDDKAFNGLSKLHSLSLARNKLTNIENVQVFEGLTSLLSLSLKGNQIKELKPAVMAPLLNNFYGSTSNLDVEDNNFPCDCRLDWFMSLMNKTLNKHLSNAIENLKCMPDANLRESWTKAAEADNNTQAVEEEEPRPDYEYYDETQLNGKLFYVDVRDLLKCKEVQAQSPANTNTLTKETPSLTTSTVNPATFEATSQDRSTTDSKEAEVDNVVDTTTNSVVIKSDKNKRENNDVDKQDGFTTTRLATVSAKPENTKIYENMASDEAKHDKNKANRSIQEDSKMSRRIEEDSHTNASNMNLGSVVYLVLTVLCSKIYHYY